MHEFFLPEHLLPVPVTEQQYPDNQVGNSRNSHENEWSGRRPVLKTSRIPPIPSKSSHECSNHYVADHIQVIDPVAQLARPEYVELLFRDLPNLETAMAANRCVARNFLAAFRALSDCHKKPVYTPKNLSSARKPPDFRLRKWIDQP